MFEILNSQTVRLPVGGRVWIIKIVLTLVENNCDQVVIMGVRGHCPALSRGGRGLLEINNWNF